jgi:hypothetical protein
MLAIVAVLLTVTPIWLPAESITLNSGSTVTGYVLSDDDGGFTTILTESHREILKVLIADIEGREVCSTESRWWPFQPILAAGAGRRVPEACPKTDP